ncbi:PQQ-like beta-propeller repeat protein [bacterium]|nr:PQQ-like beta-propeller repeat protein [bacterium]
MGNLHRIHCVAALACAVLLGACAGSGPGRGHDQPGAADDAAGEIPQELWLDLNAELARVRESSKAEPYAQNSFIQVRDFTVSVIDSGLRFDWTYRNHGDYELNLETGISDLSVLGRYYGMREADPGWEEAQVADGDGNGEIGIGDVSPIGQNFGTRVDGYTLYMATDEAHRNAEALAEFELATLRAAGSGWPAISHELPAGAAGRYYYVVPWRLDSGGVRHEGLANDSGQQVEEGSQRGDWWKANHDMRNSGLSTLPGPETGHIWWEYPLEDPGHVQPVYDSGGVIYIGDSLGLHALNGDGTGRWVYTTPAAVSTSAAISRSGTVVFGCADGTVLAVDQSGALVWSVASGAGISGDIGMADDGTILFGNQAGTVRALAPDGMEQWRHESGSAILDGPALDSRGRIHFRREAGLLMLDADGTVLEQIDHQINNGPTGLMVQETPFKDLNGDEYQASEALYYGSGEISGAVGLPLDESQLIDWPVNLLSFNQDLMHEYYGGAFCSAPGDSIIFDISFQGYGNRLVRSNFTDMLEFSELPRSVLNNGISCDSEGNALLSFSPYYNTWPYPDLDNSLISMAADGTENWCLNCDGKAMSRPVPYPGQTVLLTKSDGLLAIGGPLSGNLPEQPVITYGRGLSYGSYLEVDLSWERSNGADHYLIHRDDVSEPVATVEGHWLDLKLYDHPPAGVPLLYTVTAVNAAGQSAASEPIELILDLPAPVNFKASQAEFGDRIELSWDSVDNAEGYRIWRDGNGSRHLVAELGQVNNWNDFTRTDWNLHEYRISAVSVHNQGRSAAAEGWLIRGSGDSGASSWRSKDGNPGNNRLSAYPGPTGLDSYEEVVIELHEDEADYPTREFVLGNSGSIYSGYLGNAMAFDGENRYRWATKTLNAPAVVLDNGSLFGVGAFAHSTRMASNGEIIAVDELEDLRSVNMAANGDLLLVRYHSVTRMDQAGNIIWDFPFSDVSPAGYIVEGPQGKLYFSTDIRRDPPEPGPGEVGGGSAPPPPPRLRHIICLDPTGNELWQEPYWSRYVTELSAGPDGSIWLTANLGFLEGLPDQNAAEPALYSVSADGNLQWHSDGSTALELMAIDNSGRAILKQDKTTLLRVSPTGVVDLDLSVPEAILLQTCLVDNADRMFLSYAVSYDGEYETRILALDSTGQKLWSIDEDDWYGVNMALDDSGVLVIGSMQTVAPDQLRHFRITRIGGS